MPAVTDYAAPLKDMMFTLRHIADLDGLSRLAGLETADADLVAQVLGQGARLAGEVLAPLNRSGDLEGAVLENGVVRSPKGFDAAYRAFAEGGWNGATAEPEHGGMGLPWLVGVAAMELWNGANMGFAVGPLLTQGAIEALQSHGTLEQQALYLPKLNSGEWSGTMNLTEPQAGSDVGALRSRAEPAGDGTWRITGQKIFITYGDHELAENIVHMVLARTPDAPPGTRGLSLFIVPKYLPDENGAPGRRNDLRATGLERKLGIHASPTCTMSYGDDGGAVAFLLGEENKGMACMFTMMNTARLAIGVQGLGIGERAYQQALAYALLRRQGRALGAAEPGASAIIAHADVRRMLMTMKALVEATRAVCYVTGETVDRARRAESEAAREAARGRLEVLTPIAKAWSSDVGCQVTSLNIQVHGGMGFVEETGAAQHYRDARIAPIYEGTNGIQAMDLVMRKLTLDGGRPVADLMAAMAGTAAGVGELDGFETMAESLDSGRAALGRASEWLVAQLAQAPNAAASGCTPYLEMWGLTLGAHLLAKGVLAAKAGLEAEDADGAFLGARIASARFFAEQLLPRAEALLPAVTGGTELLYAIDEDAF